MNPGLRLLRPLMLVLPVAFAFATARNSADASKQAAATINYRERPQFPFDAQRLKRRPAIDGIIAANEWDPFYTIGPAAVNGTVYLNWDEENLYIAARTDQPAWTVINLDTSGDGWLRGNDNVELVLGPLHGAGAPPISARQLDGGGKDMPVWNETSLEPGKIKFSSRALANGQAVELAIPSGWASLNTKVMSKLGIRVDFLPATTTPAPTPPYEPHLLLEVALVETQVVSAAGVTPRLTLSDSRLTPGEELRATVELRNDNGPERRVRAIHWKGEGAAQDLLRSIREVNLPPLAGQKSLNLKYSSVLPDSTVYGAYQLSCLAELEGGGTAAATASFTVVEPFVISMPNEPESVSSGIVERIRVPIEITSALSRYEKAHISIDVPAGWSVDGRDQKRFDVAREDSTFRVSFFVNPPAGVNPGTYKFSSTVTYADRTWTASRTLKVTRPSPADSDKQDKKPER